MSVGKSTSGIILKQAGILSLCVVALYGVAWGLAMAIFPPVGGPMDTRAVNNPKGAVYLNTTRYLVWNRGVLRHPTPKILLVGGSNLQAALRLDEIRPRLTGTDVHNLSIGGMNITQMGLVFELAQEAISPEAWRKTIFVAAISYALFVHDDHHWPTWERASASRVELEMLRFGLYRKQEGKFIAQIPPRYIPEFALFLRPYLALARLRVDVTSAVTRLMRSHSQPSPGAGKFSKAAAMKMWRRYMGAPVGPQRDEQFLRLVSLAKRITRNGGRLLIVDMPLPRWHTERSPYFRDYQKRKIEFLNAASVSSSGRVTILNLQDMDDESDYRDSGHVNGAGAVKLSRRLAKALAHMNP